MKNETIYFMHICSYSIKQQLWPYMLKMASWNLYRITQRVFAEVCKYINQLILYSAINMDSNIKVDVEIQWPRHTSNNGFIGKN